MAKILVIGFGDLGSGLANVLASKGHSIWGAKRNIPQKTQAFMTFNDDTLAYITVDVSQPIPPEFFTEQWDYVVITLTPSERSTQAYEQVYLQGAKNIAYAFNRYNVEVKRFIWVSSTGVYSQNDGSWVNEFSPTVPLRSTAKILLEAEKVMENELPSLLLRFSGIYGMNRFALIRKSKALAEQYRSTEHRKDVFGFLDFLRGSERNYWTNRIHRSDCVGALAFLIEQHESNSQTLPSVLIGSDEKPTSYFEVITWITMSMGWLENPGNSTLEFDAFNPESKRCNGNKLRELGYTFHYPSFREGYVAMLKAFESEQ